MYDPHEIVLVEYINQTFTFFHSFESELTDIVWTDSWKFRLQVDFSVSEV